MKKRYGFKSTFCILLTAVMVLTTSLNTDVLVSRAADMDYSAVFDADFYYNNNSDVAGAFGHDAGKLFEHFVNFGMAEGRQGSAEFNVQAYKDNYEDLRGAFGDNLKSYYDHYVNCGKSEGRTAVVAGDNGNGGSGDNGSGVSAERYSAVFNAQYYYEHNGDLAGAIGNDAAKLFDHFLNYGMSEGRQASAEFNVQAYKNNYEDLRNAFGDNLKAYYEHYVNCGKSEGRNASDAGDNGNGGSGNDISAERYSVVFDAQYYYNHYSDVAGAFGNNTAKLLNHFVNHGMSEGRQGNDEFNVNIYKNNYVDLRNAYGDNTKAYYEHYINYGKAEGRTGSVELKDDSGDNSSDNDSGDNGDSDDEGPSDWHWVDEEEDPDWIEYWGEEYYNHNCDNNAYCIDYAKRTCTTDGYYKYKCYICGKEKKEVYKSTGHFYIWENVKDENGNDTCWIHQICWYCHDVKVERLNYDSVYNASYYYYQYPEIVQSIYDKTGKTGYWDIQDELLDDFIQNGIPAGRQGCADFNVFAYKAQNTDLANDYGNNLRLYYEHYIKAGKAEGRIADRFPNCMYTVENMYWKYELAYRNNDTSFIQTDDEKLFYRNFMACLNYANQYDLPVLKELAVHDYLVLNTKYDYDNYLNYSIPEASYQAYGVIMYGTGVCDGYRKAFNLYMDMLGIECIGVVGEANGGGHAWNQVKLDGEWYVVDVTWDDPVPDRPGRTRYNYFNITTEQLLRDHVIESENVPEATGTKYSYQNVRAMLGQ